MTTIRDTNGHDIAVTDTFDDAIELIARYTAQRHLFAVFHTPDGQEVAINLAKIAHIRAPMAPAKEKHP